MDLDQLDEALTGQPVTMTDVVAAIAVVLVGLGLAYVLGRVVQRRVGRPDDTSEQLIKLGVRVLRWVIVLVAAAWALNILGLELGWLTIVVALVAVLAAFSLRPLAENLASGVILTNRHAFGIGDEIEIDGRRGEVIEVTDHSTVLRLRDGRRTHIPNTEVVKKTVTVYTTDQARRSSLDFALTVDADVDLVESTVLGALAEADAIFQEPAPNLWLRSLGDSVQFSLRFWHASDIRAGNLAIDQAIRVVKPALEEIGVTYADSLDINVQESP